MSYEDMERMFAYGLPSARLWSVGLEEHCKESDLQKRIDAVALSIPNAREAGLYE